jgi:hypothetical protein
MAFYTMLTTMTFYIILRKMTLSKMVLRKWHYNDIWHNKMTLSITTLPKMTAWHTVKWQHNDTWQSCTHYNRSFYISSECRHFAHSAECRWTVRRGALPIASPLAFKSNWRRRSKKGLHYFLIRSRDLQVKTKKKPGLFFTRTKERRSNPSIIAANTSRIR